MTDDTNHSYSYVAYSYVASQQPLAMPKLTLAAPSLVVITSLPLMGHS